jgi:hypothetical protein
MQRRRYKADLLMAAMLCLIALGWLGDAFASTTLFEWGLPIQNLNGANPTPDNRSNFSPSKTYATQPADYQIGGDSFAIGAAGEKYHVEKIRVWMLWGVESSQGDTTPITNPLPALTLYAGPDGGPVAPISATYTSTQVWYTDGSNYQRVDGAWRAIFQLDFTVSLEINGGQKYNYFLDGLFFSNATSQWQSPSLLSSNAGGSGVPAAGVTDNNFLWYDKGTGAVTSANTFSGFGRPVDVNVHIEGRRRTDITLFEWGLPSQNLNGSPASAAPDRSNGTPTGTYYTPPATHAIDGIKLAVGSPGKQYHIDQINLWMVYGYPNADGSLVTQYSTGPVMWGNSHIQSLALWFGAEGGIAKTPATYTVNRVWHADGQNYQRLSDGAWRAVHKITFQTNLTINGGQAYYYFLDGQILEIQNGQNTYHTPSLLAAYQPTSGVTPAGGTLNNAFYYYDTGTGAIASVPSFLPQGHYADANIEIYGSEVSNRGVASSCLLLGE